MARHFALLLYDHLGQAVLLNLLWLVASLPWLAAAAAVAAGVTALGQALGHPGLSAPGLAAGAALVVLSPPSFFVVEATRAWLGPDEVGWSQAWNRTRSQALRVQGLGAATAAGMAVLLGNGLFYQGWGGWVGLVLSGVMLWLVVGVILVVLYLLPLLAARPGTATRHWLTDGAILVLTHPGAAAALLCAIAAGVVLGALSGVGLVLGGVPALALACNLGLRSQLARHGEKSLERDPRGWRDLLRPWQG